jgi:hypothetical protein
LQGKCGMVLLPQFLHTAKEIFFKAWWLRLWSRPLRVLCFLGTPMNFSPKIYPGSVACRFIGCLKIKAGVN